MGITQSDITESDFKKFWRVGDSIDHLVVWENKDNPANQLEQYSIRNDESQHFEQLYQLRKNNPYLVNAYALKSDGLSCNMDHDTEHIFIERIRLRLSNIQDVPYPSILHIYDVAIHGYSQLSNVVGFFPVDQDQIGINDRGQAKVWLNTTFQSSHVVKGQDITEASMLQAIFQIVESVVDNSTYPPEQPTMKQHLSQPTPCTTFLEASNKFVSYMRLYFNSEVPANMICVNEVGGTEMINDWCRNHESYGFQKNSLRLSEKLWRTKYSKINSSTKYYQSHPNDSAVIRYEPTPQARHIQRVGTGFSLPVIRETQNESRTYAQQSINRQTDFIVQRQQAVPQVIVQPYHQQFSTQIHPQVIISPTPQHKVIQMQLPKQTFLQPSVRFAAQAPEQNQLDHQQQIYNSEPHFISPQVRLLPQQIPIVSPSSYSGLLPPLPAQLFTESPPKSGRQGQVVISNDKLVTLSPRIVSPAPSHSSANVPMQQFPQYSPSNPFEVPSESRLQQQRVISQTIEVKQTSPQNKNSYKGVIFSPTEGNNKTVEFGQLDWQPNTQKTNYLNQDFSHLSSYSINNTHVDQKVFTPSQDGKSSPEFLALMGQLRGGAGMSHIDKQIYPQNSFTQKQQGQAQQNWEVKPAYEANAREAYSQQAFSGVGHDSPRRINEGFKYESDWASHQPQQSNFLDNEGSNSYVYSKYEVNLDPELLADLNKYKEQ